MLQTRVFEYKFLQARCSWGTEKSKVLEGLVQSGSVVAWIPFASRSFKFFMIRVFARAVCATQGRERREIVTFFEIDPCSTANRVTVVKRQLLEAGLWPLSEETVSEKELLEVLFLFFCF